jgi:nucleoside triphosphate diphosphatase
LRASIGAGLPADLPSLHRAHRLQDRAAGVGFDWPDVDGPAAKVEEELGEVREQLTSHPITRTEFGTPVLDATHAALEEELGDLLFAVVNLCRKAGVHAALALDRANAKFVRRFEGIERLAAERGIDVKTAGLEKLDGLWDEVKASEKA